jgi:hypothetical protein
MNFSKWLAEKSYRPRKYELELGPFPEWSIRNSSQDLISGRFARMEFNPDVILIKLKGGHHEC